MRDFPRRTTVHVFLKDAPDHLCLGLDNHSFTTSSRYRCVSVRQAPASQTLLDPPRLAATHFVRIVLAIKLSDQAAKAHQHGVNDALVDRPDLDPEK